MLRRCKEWEDFERKELARTDITYRDDLRIFESIRKEAVKVGALDCRDNEEHLQSIIRMARALNGLKKLQRNLQGDRYRGLDTVDFIIEVE